MKPERIEFEGADGITLIADAWGEQDAHPVLFLHGGGQTRHSWGGAASLLAGKGWRTFSIDLRGHGDSSWSPEGNYEADDFVADINAVLARLDKRAVLVGASLGGRTATLVVGNGEPEHCRALVLVDITPKIEIRGVERILSFMNKNPDGFATVEEAAASVAAYRQHRSPPRDVTGLKKNLRQKGDGRWYWHWDPVFLKRSYPHEAATSQDFSEAAARINIPTLLVRGGGSDVVSPANVRDFMKLVPHAKYVDIADAGHMVAGDKNDAFTQGIVEFLYHSFG